MFSWSRLLGRKASPENTVTVPAGDRYRITIYNDDDRVIGTYEDCRLISSNEWHVMFRDEIGLLHRWQNFGYHLEQLPRLEGL